MEKIEQLKKDIDNFLLNSNKQFIETGEIDKQEYLRIENEIDSLNIGDFNSVENYSYFDKFWRQDNRITERLLIRKFLEEDNINENSFLILTNDLRNLLSRLK